VHIALTCLGTDVTTAPAIQLVHIFGSTYRTAFKIPGTLATGTYSVFLTGAAPAFTSNNCSTLMVTNSTPKIASCIPSSSLALALGPKVTAYVPKGDWGNFTTGIGVVTIEGVGASTDIPTANAVNACSSDSITGETVCTANNTDVYLITGTTLNTTLTSGATGAAGFSGGSCTNCGVAIDAANNTAYIEEGVSGAASGTGVQALHLASNTFDPPFPMQFQVSENIAVDPFLNYIMSPGEDQNYTVLQVNPATGTVNAEFGNATTPGLAFDLDSAAEDCTTGIALSAEEFTDTVFIEDLTQAVFTPGTPGSYTAPGQAQTAGFGFSAGTSGISVAPGSSHLAVVTGEFGGNTFSVLKLPSTSGSGTPIVVDFAYTFIPPNPNPAGPCGGGYSSGNDPHTMSGYTSPNNGKAYGVFAGNGATCLVQVDLAAVLAAPRNADLHTVTTPPAAAFVYFAIP
jgi:hypothetical protein